MFQFPEAALWARYSGPWPWSHADCGSNGWLIGVSPEGFDESLLYLKGNHSMSAPQQEGKQAEFFSESHCHCAVL